MLTGLLPLFVLAHLMHHLLTAMVAPLLPMIRSEFALDYTQSGLVLSAFNLAYGFGQLPGGWLADRIGRRTMITVGILGVALCGLVVGLSNTYIMMIVFLALMGLMGGGYHPAASPAVSSTVAPENRSSALGFHVIGGSASYFLAPLAAAGIAAVLGWRGPFVILAIPTIIFGIVFYLMLGHLSGLNRAMQKKLNIEHNKAAEPPRHIRRLVAFMVLSSFTQAMTFSSIAFIPLFLVDHFGVSKEAGGAFLAVFYVGGLWASTLGGYLADRFGKIRMILLSCFAMGILTYFINLAPFGIAMGALLLIIGMFNYMRMPIAESYIIQSTSEKHRSTILGIYFFSSMEGSGVMTPLMGYIIDTSGFYYCYAIAATSVTLMTLVCFFFLRGSKD